MSVDGRSEARPLLETSNFSHVKIRQSVQTESEDESHGGGNGEGFRR